MLLYRILIFSVSFSVLPKNLYLSSVNLQQNCIFKEMILQTILYYASIKKSNVLLSLIMYRQLCHKVLISAARCWRPYTDYSPLFMCIYVCLQTRHQFRVVKCHVKCQVLEIMCKRIPHENAHKTVWECTYMIYLSKLTFI